MEERTQQVITVQRRWYSHSKLDDVYPRAKAEKASNLERLKNNCFCSKKRVWKILTTFIPLVKFIQKYKREYILGDFLGGLTATFMHLPQGLAFGLLAGLRPINGLYATFFPVIIYLLFGTSPHVSFGSNAVMALLTQTIVQRELDSYISDNPRTLPFMPSNISNMTNSSELPGTTLISNTDDMEIRIGAAMTATLLTGLILFGLGFLRLGFLTRFMSISFIGGFTTAAAIHIASSQIPKLLGISVRSKSGPGRLVNMYIDLFSDIESTVISDLVIGIATMIILLIVKVMINERYKAKLKIPIPIDFIVVVIGTVISYLGKFEENFNVKIVGDIPAGFPIPSVPKLHSASRLIMDCVVMAVLSLAMTISLAKLMAKNHGITIDDNQELMAYGLCNMGSSFFQCFPQSTAPPRTMVLSDLGAKTTLNAIPTGVIILCIILWIGTLFQSLPVSILAAMIIVAMKNLLLQFRDLPRLWRINKFDFFIWIITCLVSVFVELDYGLLVGIGVSIISVIIQNQMASGRLIGYSEKDNMFVDTKGRTDVTEMKFIKIFQFQAPLYFANAESFKTLLYRQVGNPNKMKKNKTNQHLESAYTLSETIPNGNVNEMFDDLRHVILDFQMISHVDLSGVNMLSQIVKEYKSVDIDVYIVKCSSRINEILTAANFFGNFPKDHVLYDHADAIYFINVLQSSVPNANQYISPTMENTKL